MLTDAQNLILRDYLDAAEDGAPFFEIRALHFLDNNFIAIRTKLLEINGSYGLETFHTDVYDEYGERIYDLESHTTGARVKLPKELQMTEKERAAMLQRLTELVNANK